ncbi:MAG: rRNA maturation RNase YbeY, partial [Nitrososphaerales archaeon]
RRYRIGKKLVTGYVRRILKDGKQRNAKLSVIFIDSRYCRFINNRYLRHDYVTDVISFPLEKGKNLEGEIYVNLDRVRQQARRYRVSFANEIARLVVHGTLHLVGYDDRTTKGASRMKKEENKHIQFWFS